MIRNIIKEELSKVFETELNEDYPSYFDMDYFKSLNSFNQRIKYCQENLQRISSGSSRIVYKIDDEKVLKLAKNKKGLAQNENEISHSQESLLEDVVANVFDYHPDDLWVEMEFAQKLTTKKFKEITEINWTDFIDVLNNYQVELNRSGYKKNIPEEINDLVWENEFAYQILSYMGNYDVHSGDFDRLSSYGVVKRDGKEIVVLIDYGLSNDAFKEFYS